MRIEVITTYWREEYLAPLFMLHYEPWADQITMLTGRMPDDKMDDGIKLDLIHSAIARSTADWCILVDFDEFVFPKDGGNPRTALENESGSVCQCDMLRVWRHMSDVDINRLVPPMHQRRHGQADHSKPCIFRPHPSIRFDIGSHGVSIPPGYKYGASWSAVHWANADPEFGIQRSHSHRQMRLSDNQLSQNWGVIPEWRDPSFLEKKYLEHLNDPLVL